VSRPRITACIRPGLIVLGVIAIMLAAVSFTSWIVDDRARMSQRVVILEQYIRARGGTPPPGLSGRRGDKGDTGTAGVPGGKGDTGSTGKPGKDGRDGKRGSPGPVVTGSPGGPGEKGDTGDKGDRGETGPKGDTGEPGPTCPSGYHVEDVAVMTDNGFRTVKACVTD
jgi:hypothetical protein